MKATAGASSSRLAQRITSRLVASARGQLNKRAARRVLPTILDRLETQHGGRRLHVHALDVTSGGRVAAHIGAEQPTAIVKLATRVSHRRSLQRQARILRLIHACERLGDFAALVPQPLLAGEHEDWTYLVESRLAGRPASGVLAAEGEFERNALGAIARLHEATAGEVVVDGRQLDRWVHRRARTASLALHRRFDPSAAQPLDNVVMELGDILAGRSLRVGWIHGDYWAGNILVAAGSITGVLDWDSMLGNELPLHDVLHLLVTQQRLRERRPWGSVVRELLLAPGQPPLERSLPELGAALASLTWRGALLIYWLHVIDASLRRHPGAAGSRAWLAANVTPVLEVSA